MMKSHLKGTARLVIFAAIFGAAASMAVAEPFRLIVTDLEAPLVPNSVMDLAVNLGYFENEGVDVDLVRVQQTPSALAGLQAGEGDMANISVDALVQLVARGTDDLRAVLSPNKSLPFLIAAKEEIQTTADLTDRPFGIGRLGSLDHSLSTQVLETHGSDVDTLQLVSLGQPSVRAQALAAGRIDATTMSIGVWMSLPDKEGLHVLISQDDYYAAAPVVNKVNAITTQTLSERREDVEAVTAALIKISRDVAANPQIWVDGMVEARPDMEQEQLEELVQSFSQSWSVNGGLSADELAYTVETLYESEDFTDLKPVTLDQWVDFSVVDAVLEDLSVAPEMDQPTR